MSTVWNAYNNIVLYPITMPTAGNAYNNIVSFLITMPMAWKVKRVSLQHSGITYYTANGSDIQMLSLQQYSVISDCNTNNWECLQQHSVISDYNALEGKKGKPTT